MYVREEDAAAMYARACISWYGAKARRVVGTKIRHLRRIGDVEGVKAWSQVAAQLSKTQKRTTPIENGKLY
jgi:hypothetical protein